MEISNRRNAYTRSALTTQTATTHLLTSMAILRRRHTLFTSDRTTVSDIN